MISDIPGGSRGSKSKRGAGSDLLGPNSEIGRKLKEYYDGLSSPDVPDRFEHLLAQLEKAEHPHGAKPDKKD